MIKDFTVWMSFKMAVKISLSFLQLAHPPNQLSLEHEHLIPAGNWKPNILNLNWKSNAKFKFKMLEWTWSDTVIYKVLNELCRRNNQIII